MKQQDINLQCNTAGNSEVVLFQPDDNFRLEVRLEEDTVWLNRQQMSLLFDRDVKTIGKHINNALREELNAEFPVVANNATTQTIQTENQVVAKFATTANDGKTYQVEYYNLDVILSVGYRVKSPRGIQFRKWANKVLKEYLLRGYAINQQLISMQRQIDSRFDEQTFRMMALEQKVANHQQQIDFFVRTNKQPIEGVFYEGQVFDAFKFIETLLQSATSRVILIDNYIDAKVIDTLDQRPTGAKADVFTSSINANLTQAANCYMLQHPDKPLSLKTCSTKFHDRFLIIDNDVYHIGASIKDLGKRLFAFSRMNIGKDVILGQL